jgi:glycosyltransferase involved in cell wall biosynthesis
MKVSVVIPAWNAEATIAETLESIAKQTVPANEIILVDDGSTDATVDVAQRVCPEIRVFRQQQAGAAAALNRGVRECNGPLLAFLDADDLWVPGKLEMQLAILENAPHVDAVIGRVELFLCPSLNAEAMRRYRLPKQPQIARLMGALLVRRTAFDRVGAFAEDLHVGYAIDWFDRAHSAGIRFAIPEDTVFRRRMRPGSLGHRNEEKDRVYLEMVRRALVRRRAPASASQPDEP